MTVWFSRFSCRITDGRRPGKEKDLRGYMACEATGWSAVIHETSPRSQAWSGVLAGQSMTMVLALRPFGQRFQDDYCCLP